MLWILRAREKKHHIRVDLKICVYKRKSFWRSIYSVDTKVVVWICKIYACRDYEQFPLKLKRLWITRSTFSALFLGLVCVIGGPIASFSFIGGSGLRGPSSRWNRIRWVNIQHMLPWTFARLLGTTVTKGLVDYILLLVKVERSCSKTQIAC